MDLKDFLELKYKQYNSADFITTDPISVPHRFSQKEDIEIAGFLVATIAWGQRPTIITNALRMLAPMGPSPYQFVVNFREEEMKFFDGFVHRTFNMVDLQAFLAGLKRIYCFNGCLETVFKRGPKQGDMGVAIHHFREEFFKSPHLPRTRKHISDPLSGSSAKRLNMFLRWMIRQDAVGVDFGIWKSIDPKHLVCPLDVHSGRVARKLGLLHRKQNDWKAALELTQSLKTFDPLDPVKYDFALFGLGVFEKF